ncbi:DUF2314 domain-containing protein [Chryseobacterium indologenes]|uniref:DUF2314 domain-containing protein n=1 Tax=Chryseobacterium indologenes TaxID=253 RepID=UPI0003E068A1|nr:DUF2314 domain-containing protein [Chryseobacterium indologenes]QPQ51284.1 DUF2314 domain-containing protein [Chryseobacterium indologenes]GAE66933.1 hypothetical protein CIN01S_20_00590 [Chryseobacterium indologenes NBRC 14944]SFI95690.1 hypothetical protein SAMN05421692_1117 [Chryseobacterium indologenes]SUX49685.1 Uncharacterized protein conserved in bacteria (DUF2314) [Chryseobacterium indologenes]
MNNSAKIEENEIYQYNLYKAKNTLWYFNELIKNGFSEYNCVKFKNKEGVYVWLENVKIEESNYLGHLAENELSQKISIEEVIDWMIIEEGRLVGGYTIRHYRDTLDDEAKMNFDIDFGVKIDDVNDFFKPDFRTPEGAIITIENFYSDKNLSGVLSCKNFLQEAENLLEERKIDVTEELTTKIAETLKTSFIEGIESNGFPYFKDIERNFSLKEKLENKHLIEEKITYPDKTTTINTLWVGYSEEQKWKVLNLVD